MKAILPVFVKAVLPVSWVADHGPSLSCRRLWQRRMPCLLLLSG